ncbi:sugar ABC transporter substrate-binding protein [Clostridia bacterium]|nr:sugar ABC transporter substrate-binding protein [Clostridia bacterium]
MKKWILLALAALLCFMLAACRSEDDFLNNNEDVDEDDLLVWTVDPIVGNYSARLKTDPGDKRALMTRDIVKKFQDDTGVSVVLKNVGWGLELQKQLRNAIATGTMPDVTVGEQYINVMQQNGHFAPLDLGDDLLNKLSPQLKAQGSYDGKLYSAAVSTGSFSLTVNKKVLRDNGILTAQNAVDPTWQAAHSGVNPLAPVYWDDLLTICQELKTKMSASGGGGILLSNTTEGSSWRALAYMATAGGGFLDAKGDVKLDTAENAEAFAMMRELVKTAPANSIDAATENAMWDDYLFKNKAAYTVEGIDAIVMAASKSGVDKNDYIAAELPMFKSQNKKANVLVGSGYYSIAATSTKKGSALKFVKFLLSDFVQLKMATVDMRIPSMTNVIQSDELKNSEVYPTLSVFMKPFTDLSYTVQTYPAFEDNASEVWEKWDVFTGALLKPEDKTAGTYKPLTAIVNKAQADMYGKQHGG